MTFLLFLASLALLRHLVKDVGREAAGQCIPSNTLKKVDAAPPSAAVSTDDLMALGKALGNNSKVADSEHVIDRVTASSKGALNDRLEYPEEG
jgi:hypothetical protein